MDNREGATEREREVWLSHGDKQSVMYPSCTGLAKPIVTNYVSYMVVMLVQFPIT